MGFCSCVNKLFLVLLNFIILAVGVVVIALASVVIHKGSEYGDLFLDGILTLPIWTLIVGIAITVLGFFGCCGALNESTCMLYTYASVVSLLFLAEVTLGILIAIYPDKAVDHIEEGMSKAFKEYNGQDQSLKNAIDSMQHELHCCGVNGPQDWLTWGQLVPKSCCERSSFDICADISEMYNNGCLGVIANNLKPVTLALGISALVLAIIQVFCVCVACGLAHKKSQYV